METIKLKTNINCGGCIAKVTPFLNSLKGKEVDSWQVNTDTPEKVLTVTGSALTPELVLQTIAKAGFKGEALVA